MSNPGARIENLALRGATILLPGIRVPEKSDSMAPKLNTSMSG